MVEMGVQLISCHQIVVVLVAEKWDLAASRQFFTRALEYSTYPAEVNTDRAAAYPRVLDELLPSTCHVTTGMRTTGSNRSRVVSRPARGR